MNTNQGLIFLIFIANGISIGLAFDFFRILRKSFKTSNIITYIEDILFWIITSVFTIFTLYFFCDGQIRIFMFVGEILGFCIYILTVSKQVICISMIVIGFLKNIIKVLLKPIISFLQIINKSTKKYNNKLFSKIKFKKIDKKRRILPKKGEN